MNIIKVLNDKEILAVTSKIDTSIIFVIESSNKISGEYLETLNNYIFEAIHSLIELQKQSIHNIGLQIIEFNEECRLSASCNPGNIKEFYWEGIKNTKPKADMGAALEFLREKVLNARSIRNTRLPPIIVFFSTGQSTDNTDSAIEKLNKCKIFKDALKMAISIGDETDMELLSMITGTKEAIFHIEDLEREFRQILGIVPTGTIKDHECDNSFEESRTQTTYQEGFQLRIPCGDIFHYDKKTSLFRCQLMPCSPESANEEFFILHPIEPSKQFCEILVKSTETICIRHMIHPGDNYIVPISLNSRLIIQGDSNIEILNGELIISGKMGTNSLSVDTYISCDSEYRLYDGDNVLFNGNIILKVNPSKEEEWEKCDWDEDATW